MTRRFIVAVAIAASSSTTAAWTARAAAPIATVASARGLQMVTFTLDEGALYLRLPDDMAAAETIAGSFFFEPAGKTDAERATNLTSLRALQIVLDDQTRAPVTSPFSWTTPRFDGADAKFFEIALANARGGSLCKARLRIHPAVLAPPPGQTPNAAFVLPRFGQHGGRTEITGPFDGRLDTTSLRMGDENVDVAAESPRRAVFFGPATIVGETTLVLTERTTTVRIEYRHVKVSLSAPKTNLQRGEQTTLTATVTGLANLKADVPLYLEKFGVVRMERGDSQVVRITPQDAADGSYTTSRGITGFERGSFVVNATVVYEPFDITIVDQTTIQILQIHSLTGDYSFCAAGVRVEGRGSIKIDNGVVELADSSGPRRVQAKLTPGSRQAKGTLQLTNPSQSFALSDQDTRNNPTACGPS